MVKVSKALEHFAELVGRTKNESKEKLYDGKGTNAKPAGGEAKARPNRGQVREHPDRG